MADLEVEFVESLSSLALLALFSYLSALTALHGLIVTLLGAVTLTVVIYIHSNCQLQPF